MKNILFNTNSSASIRFLIIIILTLSFTTFCVRESARIGRLATSPNYDDVVYFHEGAILLQSLKTDGLRGFRTFLNDRGLHSPYSIFLAATAFETLGLHESSPYEADSLVVLTYLIGIAWFLRKLPLLAWSAGLLLFLTPPFITMGVVEFRPDIAWAVVMGFGIVVMVTSESLFRNPKSAAVAGLFLALALIIKPSTFVMTLLLYSGAILSRIVGAVWESRWRSAVRETFPGVVAFSGTILVVAGPYWWRFGKDAVSYFMENSFGKNKAIWVFQGDFSKFLLFYVTGEGAQSNISISGSILCLLALVCLFYLWVKSPDLRWKLFSILMLLLGALMVNTVAQMKSPFLGGGIYGVLIFASAYVIGKAYIVFQPTVGKLELRRVGWKTAVLMIAASLAIIFYRWPEYSNWGRDRASMNNFRFANNFMQSLLNKHVANPPKSILFTASGPIIMESTGFWFPLHGLKSTVCSCIFIRKKEQFQQIYSKNDWIVIQEQGVMGTFENIPSEKLLPTLLAELKDDSNYSQIAEFVSGNSRKVWVYSRRKSDDRLN